MSNSLLLRRLAWAGLCAATLVLAGCRCDSKTSQPAPRPKAAVELPAAATVTDLPAPATPVVIEQLRTLADAPELLNLGAKWLAPRFGAGLTPGRHGLARAVRGSVRHDIVEVTAAGVTVEWRDLGPRFERNGRDCVVRSGATVAQCPGPMVEQTSLLVALIALSRPETWSEGVWRVEALGGRSGGETKLRLASPRFGVRFEVTLQSDGAVTELSVAGHTFKPIEDGRALDLGERGTWRWEALAEAPSPGYQALRIPLAGSLTADIQGVERAIGASGVATRQDCVEFEIERTAQGVAWRAVLLPVAQDKPVAPATPGIVTARQGSVETSGLVTVDLQSGLEQLQSTIAALPLPAGCHILRIVVDDGGGSALQPSLYTVRGCAP